MKTVNNPFLATNQQYKTSIVSSVNDSNKTNSTLINRKFRRQTISDPNAYIRYISYNYQQHSNNNKNNNNNNSSFDSKCISNPSANTMAKSTTTTTATGSKSTRTTFNDDKSQKQCQQQQQLQQISLQFQGITLYDNDVAKSQQINNNSVNTINANNEKLSQQQQQKQHQQANIIINSCPWYDNKEREQALVKQIQQTKATAFKILSQQVQQSKKSIAIVKEKEESKEILSHEKNLTSCRMIDGELAQQIIGYNFSNNNNNNTKDNKHSIPKLHTFYGNRDKWMGTYPTTRAKKFMSPITTTTTTTFTTTTTATRMTPKIVPTAVISAQRPPFISGSIYCGGSSSSSNNRSGNRCLRKHHSFHIQPTTSRIPRHDLKMTNDMHNTHNNTLYKQSHMDIMKRQQEEQKQTFVIIDQQNSVLNEVLEEKEKEKEEEQAIQAGIEFRLTEELRKGVDGENYQKQQIIQNRCNTWGGPLVYRPLTLNEKHAFKPISPRPHNNVNASMSITNTVEINKPSYENSSPKNNYYSWIEEEKYGNKLGADEKSLESAEFSAEMQELTDIVHLDNNNNNNNNSGSENSVTGAVLHPAASLEVLEALTQSNPELIYAATQPGSRLNLHTQLSALNRSKSYNATGGGVASNDDDDDGVVNFKVKQLRAKLQAKLCDGEYNEKLSLPLSSQEQNSPKKILCFGGNDIFLDTKETENYQRKINENKFVFLEKEEELDNLNRFSSQNDNNMEINDDINIKTDEHCHNNNNDNNNNNNNDCEINFDFTSNSNVSLNSPNSEGQVKYLVTQNYREIRI